MAMGKRKRKLRQQSIWIATQELPRSASHPFYKRLNRILEQNGFDEYVEQLCESFYAPTLGRPSLAPGMYFRVLMLGYFEGIDSERGIAWRAADSLSVREFVGLELGEAPPDHSTISRTRRLIEVETHRAVFSWILDRLAAAGLVKGETLGVDATTLEANAALRSIVRRDTGEGYEAFLTRLAKASGIATPTREDLARLDRKRPKKGSNDDWTHPQDPDARITKMKDGRTHLAHKAEHALPLLQRVIGHGDAAHQRLAATRCKGTKIDHNGGQWCDCRSFEIDRAQGQSSGDAAKRIIDKQAADVILSEQHAKCRLPQQLQRAHHHIIAVSNSDLDADLLCRGPGRSRLYHARRGNRAGASGDGFSHLRAAPERRDR